MRQLLDVVYQAVQLPLRIDLSLPSERKAIQLLVVADIAVNSIGTALGSGLYS